MYQNPVVPAEASLNILTLTPDFGAVNFVFPTSFPPYVETQYAMSAIVIFESTDSLSDFTVTLPDATLGALGNASIFVNTTSFNIIIKDVDNASILTLLTGDSVQLVLKNNENAAGEWEVITLGATTSGANAGALAGGGLTAYGSKLNTTIDTFPVLEFPTEFTLEYNSTFYLYDLPGNETWSLPTPPFKGFIVYVKNLSSTNGIITINVSGGGTIDDGTSKTLTRNQSIFLIYDEADKWYSIGTNELSGSGVRITANGIQVINGSAANPSISFINYTNTGFYSGGADSLSVSVQSQNVAAFIPEGINATNLYWDGLSYFWVAGLYP